MVVVDGQGIPLGGQVTTASPSEVTLVDSTLSTIKVPRQGRGRPKSNPERLIADKAYDSDKLRKRLKERGIDVHHPAPSQSQEPQLTGWQKITALW